MAWMMLRSISQEFLAMRRAFLSQSVGSQHRLSARALSGLTRPSARLRQNSLRRFSSTPARAASPAPSDGAKDCVAQLSGVGVLKVHGPHAAKLLQNLFTNDVATIAARGSGYTALLNQKGRFLFDAIVTTPTAADAASQTFFLHAPSASLAALQAHAKKFVMRQKVQLEDVSSQLRVWSVMSQRRGVLADTLAAAKQDAAAGVLAFADPRAEQLGVRLVLPADQSRVHDMLFEKSLPMECNLDWLNAISFTKGCYLGQELTARTHFQGLVRKRLMPALVLDSSAARLAASASSGGGGADVFASLYRGQGLHPQQLPGLRTGELAAGASVFADAAAEAAGKESGKVFSSLPGLALVQLRLESAAAEGALAEHKQRLQQLSKDKDSAELLPAPIPASLADVLRSGSQSSRLLTATGAGGQRVTLLPFVPAWWPAPAPAAASAAS